MSGWQPTKGKAAAIGGVGAGSMASRREHTRAVKKHPACPREAQEAHGRIGRWFVQRWIAMLNAQRLSLSAAV